MTMSRKYHLWLSLHLNLVNGWIWWMAPLWNVYLHLFLLTVWSFSCAVAGITADANILINYARLTAQRYFYAYQVSVACFVWLISIASLFFCRLNCMAKIVFLICFIRNLWTHLSRSSSVTHFFKGTHPNRATLATNLWFKTRIHSIRWSPTIRCLILVCRVGWIFWIPTLSKWS